jgi:hypothetical protein
MHGSVREVLSSNVREAKVTTTLIAPARERFELVELPGCWSVIDLEAERLASPKRAWSRSDAELVAGVLVERPGYALQLPWRSAR